MTEINSPQNPRLKALRRLQTKRGRAASGRFVAEGEDLMAAASNAGWRPLEAYRLAGAQVGIEGEEFVDVQRAALGSVSVLGSGTRAVGVYEQRWSQPAGSLCVYLHGVGDPGNVGTIVRSAQAFGASCVIVGPRCADPYAPKAVRASMGAVFAVALARGSEAEQLPGVRVALCAHEGEPLQEVLAAVGGQALTLLVGAEREGLPAELVAACEHEARIEIASESLNAAMAATVALYETTRRRGRDNDTVPAS
jgi:RNA methyltransferase, TrmH family